MTFPAGSEQVREAAAHLSASQPLQVVLDLARARGAEVFLVGGTVRELALGGRTPDLDLAVSRQTLDLALDLARATGGTFVLLDEKERTARVVAGEDTLDLAEFRGPTLEEDLKGRDFTINSMALDLRAVLGEAPLALIDPLGGLEHLAQGLIRLVSADNLPMIPYACSGPIALRPPTVLN